MGLTECSNMNIMPSNLSLLEDNVLCHGSVLTNTGIDYNCHCATEDYWISANTTNSTVAAAPSHPAAIIFPNPIKHTAGKQYIYHLNTLYNF